MKRILFAGTGSGCGKTTVTCAVMYALRRRGMRIASFKCGPDYIDPLFHREVIGTDAHNLDGVFCNDDLLLQLLDENSSSCDISVIEGVMGFYDGGRGSAHFISGLTDTPVVLVVNSKGMSESLGAVIKGFLSYRSPNNIIGVIFSRLPLRMADEVRALCESLGTEYLGALPDTDAVIESRRLGLVTPDDLPGLEDKLRTLGALAEQHILLDRLTAISERRLPAYLRLTAEPIRTAKPPVIAAARDNAFCFIYPDNIALLERLGCRIEYFSPLKDKAVPDGADGLLLYGGYPELYAPQLSQNRSMLESVKSAVLSGMPVIAECGGFMYLHDVLETADGAAYSMAGVIHGRAYSTDRLKRFGYAELHPKSDSMLFRKSENIAVHEFHYYESSCCGDSLVSMKKDGRSWSCCHCSGSMYAGFPHIYFYADIRTAVRFAEACAEFGGQNEKDH